MKYPSRKFLLQQGASCALGRISWAGFVNNPCGQMNPVMRPYGTYALVYLLEGHGEYANERGMTARIGPGDLIVTFPDIARNYGAPADSPWREMYIIFDGPVFDLWRSKGLLDENRPVRHLEPIDHWVRRFAHVIDAGTGVREMQTLKRIIALQDLLTDILAHERLQAFGDAERAWLDHAHALLEQMDPLDRPDYGPLLQELGLSYAGFRNRFTRLAGISPGRYIAKLQIRRVCNYLETTDLKLRQIAERCGFTDEYHLSRRFKQLMGITPREFRRRMPARMADENEKPSRQTETPARPSPSSSPDVH